MATVLSSGRKSAMASDTEPLLNHFIGVVPMYNHCSNEVPSSSHAVVSFDWSDFPIGQQNDENMWSFQSTTMKNSWTSIPHNQDGSPFPNAVLVTTASSVWTKAPFPLRSIPLTSCVTHSEKDSSNTTVSHVFPRSHEPFRKNPYIRLTKEHLDNDESERPNPQNRVVRFARDLKIYTIPVVLGEHPCCAGGMALVTGPCEDGDKENVKLVDFNNYERQSLKRRTSDLRLDYYARQERLQELTGLSTNQLFQQEYELLTKGCPLQSVEVAEV